MPVCLYRRQPAQSANAWGKIKPPRPLMWCAEVLNVIKRLLLIIYDDFHFLSRRDQHKTPVTSAYSRAPARERNRYSHELHTSSLSYGKPF